MSASIFRFISRSKSNNSAAQLLFCRGITSKLFVKGLSFSTTEDTLANAFSQFGEVVEAKIIFNKTSNRSKGYGYVTFNSVDEAEKALSDMNGKILEGRVLFVDNVRPRRPGPRED
ncbi:small RNA-binding protein 11, chloroplastic-like [Mangifera indica]|uniref:small RNA-binding protein 11, chloroplastic-like n=1 Tax=Mangifera indica TaxID=29780 RepID=UPI001CFB063D|nr:small RNA-binding protein 11, chloroplastic-like [Mangifera indica]